MNSSPAEFRSLLPEVEESRPRTTSGSRELLPDDADENRIVPAPRPGYRWLLVLLPLFAYIAGLNPFYLPNTFDNIVYHFGALSLAEEGTFKFRGKYIADWPPGVSALIAIPFFFGFQSVWTAKICVLLCAAAGLVLALRLFEKENRPSPLLTLAIFALLPISLMMGTRTMSEWPYFAASIIFLLVLRTLRDADATFRMAAVAGLLLGMAALTKFTGVLLGVAIVAQVVEKWIRARGRFSFRTILPELLAASIGAGMFLAWKIKIHWQIQAGTAHNYDYYRSGFLPEHFGWIAPLSVPLKITDLLFHTEAAMNWMGWDGLLARLACAAVGGLVIFGMLLRLCSKDRSCSDWYVLSLLFMFAAFENNQQTRYLMPIAPFLIGYGFIGVARIYRWVRSRDTHALKCCVWINHPKRIVASQNASPPAQGFFAKRIRFVCVGGWIALLVASALQLLFIGNLSGTHRGLFYFSSHTPENFYRGFWLDLYHACDVIRHDSTPGSLAVFGHEDKYVTAFSGRHYVDFDEKENFAYLLVLKPNELPQNQFDMLSLQRLQSNDSLALYKRSKTHVAETAVEARTRTEEYEKF